MRRARRRKPRCCILGVGVGGEVGSESPRLPPSPRGAAHARTSHPRPHSPGLRAGAAAGFWGRPLAASRGAQPEASPWGGPGAQDAAQTPTLPPAPRAAGAQRARGRGRRHTPAGTPRAHSLAARGAALPPAPGPSRSGRRGPFCLQNRSEPVTWAPAPSPPPPPRKDPPRPLPSNPRRPQTPASPPPLPPRASRALLPRLPAAGPRTTPRSPRPGRPRSDDGLCRSPVF